MASKYMLKFTSIQLYFKNNDSLLERGENSFQSGHVEKVDFDGELLVIHGLVQASMKAKMYKVKIYLTNEYRVQNAQCECPRGRVICHHIAATLFAAHYKISTTDGSCSWLPKKPTKEGEVQTCKQLLNLKPHPRLTERDLTDTEIEVMAEKLNTFGPVGFLWLLKNEFDDSCDVLDDYFDFIDIAATLGSNEFVTASNQEHFLREKLKLNKNHITKIAEVTVGQHRNPNWFLSRKLRITASHFGSLIGCISRNRYPPSLYKNLIGATDLGGIKAIQWGREHENDALKQLADELKQPIRSTGIWLSESGVLGASPDGLVGDDCVVEAKCPFRYRNVSLREVLEKDKSYIIRYNKSADRWDYNKDHEYFHQIQGQIHLANKAAAHLVVWTPMETAMITIPKNDDWADNLLHMETFFSEKFLPYVKEYCCK